MNDHAVKRTLLIALLLGMIVVTGCANADTRNNALNVPPPSNIGRNDVSDEKTITVSGIKQTVEVSESRPIELVISGTDNVIIVKDGTTVVSIVLSGIGNKVTLPKDSKPEIVNSGIDNTVTHAQ